MPDSSWLVPGLSTHAAKNCSSEASEGGAADDLSSQATLEKQQLQALAAQRVLDAKPGSKGRFCCIGLTLFLMLVISVRVGSVAWAIKRSSPAPKLAPVGGVLHPKQADVDEGLAEKNRMELLNEHLSRELIKLLQRPERHELPLQEIVSGVLPGEEAALASLDRALNTLSCASAATQKDIADNYLDHVLSDYKDRGPSQFLQDMLKAVQEAAPAQDEDDPKQAEAHRARTAFLVAVLDTFTARVEGLEQLRTMAEALEGEEARLKEENSVEVVGLADLLRELQETSREAAEAAAQQTYPVDSSVPKFKAKHLLNRIHISRQKLLTDLKVAAALLVPLNLGRDLALRDLAEPFEARGGIGILRAQTTMFNRESEMIQIAVENSVIILQLVHHLETTGQGETFLGMAFDLLGAVHRLTRERDATVTQSSDFWQFLRDNWSADVHDQLCEVLKSMDEAAEKRRLAGRSFLVTGVKKWRRSGVSQAMQVDILLLQAAIALL